MMKLKEKLTSCAQLKVKRCKLISMCGNMRYADIESGKIDSALILLVSLFLLYFFCNGSLLFLGPVHSLF